MILISWGSNGLLTHELPFLLMVSSICNCITATGNDIIEPMQALPDRVFQLCES